MAYSRNGEVRDEKAQDVDETVHGIRLLQMGHLGKPASKAPSLTGSAV